jgi:hypothetical protein
MDKLWDTDIEKQCFKVTSWINGDKLKNKLIELIDKAQISFKWENKLWQCN